MRGRKPLDLTGHVYGKLKVGVLSHRERKGGVWWCKCECGASVRIGSWLLRATEHPKRDCGGVSHERRHAPSDRTTELYEKFLSGFTKVSLAKEYAISPQRVAQIIKREETRRGKCHDTVRGSDSEAHGS